MKPHLALACLCLAVIPWWTGKGLAALAKVCAGWSGWLYDKANELVESQ